MKHLEKNQWPFFKVLFFFFMGIALLNIFAAYFFFRIDLTEDKRYSIHETTKTLLQNITDPIYVKVYLAGDLPAGFKRLQEATQAMLEEFKVYAHHRLQYRCIDPDEWSTQQKKTLIPQLIEKGIQPTNLHAREKGKKIEKLIFPGALVGYQDKDEGVMLLQGNKWALPEEILNQSIEGLEYALSRAINKLINPTRKKVALVRGHGEPDTLRLSGLMKALQEYYEVYFINFAKEKQRMHYDALLITKPQQAFSEKEKYELDQYIMQGGKVLFFLDRIRIDMDSLRHGGTFALPLDVGLDDQLFRYGVRMNPDLIQDLQAGVYPVITGNFGHQPQVNLLPWPFFPIINHFSNHLIVKNLDALYGQFMSSIDTVRALGVKKTPLAFTSRHAHKTVAPIQVDLETLREVPRPAAYTHGPMPVIYLLEGQFTSLYKNRMLPDDMAPTHFLWQSQPAKLCVASGNWVLNGLDTKKKYPLPWGYDPFLQRTFAQEDFVLNTLAYMLDAQGLINAKNKTIALRLLDKVKIDQESRIWQILNIFLPVALLLILGLIGNSLYCRAYTKF